MKPKILICEDEMVIALDLKQTLSRMGYEIVGTVTKGEDLITRFDETKPDLVITDIKLKGKLNGIEAAKIITEKNNVPILFLTGQSDEKTFQEAMMTNPCSYLRKPFTESSLYDAINVCIPKEAK